MIKDMTEGKPIKLIFQFFIPLILGNLFQQLYNMVDSAIVGKFVGVNALAGVGATGSLNFLILGFAMGICGGFGIMFGQKFGARDYRAMRRYIANSYYLVAIISAILTPITVIFCRQFLIWMDTPAEIMEDAYNYIVVIFGGISVTMLYNTVSAALRAIGDSKTPLYALVGSSIINIILDFVLVVGFRMGTLGAGIATVTAQAVSGVVCLIYMYKKYELLRFQKGEGRFVGVMAVHLLGLGIPMALQFSITAIGTIIIQAAVNGLGAAAVAAMTTGSKISTVFSGALEMLGMAMATYCSQNMGAGKYDRIKSGVRAGIVLAAAACAVLITVLMLLEQPIILLFLDKSQTEIIENTLVFIRWNAFCYPLLGLLFILRNALQGMGYSAISMLAGVSELIGRCLVAFLCIGPLGYVGGCLANPAAWLLADIILAFSYLYAKKKVLSMAVMEGGNE